MSARPRARAVAASPAFPPVLSPLELRLNPNQFEPKSGQDLQRKPFTSRVFLTDGGVYDNLGLSDRTAIEFFNGGHTINGAGTFDFLPRTLDWPRPPGER